ncbi:LPP20 family lipoprotein [Candidatus Sumerlaeota bacterium]|nr:LPP20 family lipoprotein [Candidatus Sumerlaeota bacterium]
MRRTNAYLSSLLVVGLALLIVGNAAAEKTVKTEAQARLMAKRAAITDGQRQMLEIVKGVEIDSRTKVRDFITESDEINSRVHGVIRGAETVDTRYLDDGSCEVDLELQVRNLTSALQRNFPYPDEVIRVTGVGVMNEVDGESQPMPASEVEDLWYTKTIKATGAGVPPAGKEETAQGRRLAERAALEDARRQLLELILGVEIKSATHVRDFVTESDEINSRVKGFLRGAYKTETRQLDDGSVEVDIEINLRGLRTILYDRHGNAVEIVE